MEIKTKRLILRSINSEDAKLIFDYRSNKEVNKYQSWIPATLDEVINFIANKVNSEINIADSWFQFVITLKENNQLIGDLGIHFFEDHSQIELGCTLNQKYQGKGYASESLTAIIKFAFMELNKHRITASVDPRNMQSVNLIESLGFRKEAHFKESYLHNGAWVDDVVYALLRKEYLGTENA